ncbi:tetratricopeptide repeat protein [Mesobacillus selenatarsenatis]|uniref:Tetratricopeptide repeat protein n=1 Tax=Mesobacillus selenatarsenatis TaxID=388741 RepID=A0A846TAW4_9BACI|nr:hypothetical protein [Mesobacillus selenatarsenatis]NKE04000.1 hypothetical protein [Mesobacillus selenatarsenatis]
MARQERELHPKDEEKRLKDELMEARKKRDRTSQHLIEKKLVKLYVSQAEYFKMAEKPDPNIAKRYLETALRIQKDHPVANYRLGYLFYRNNEYTKAIFHFGKALDGSATEGLNDTQTMLANMFMVNCGIRIAKESILEIQSIEENLYSDLEKERVQKYRNEILVLDEDVFERMFYRKIENGMASRISESEFAVFQPKGKQVMLRISDQGREILFPDGFTLSLNPVSFYLFYGLLTAEEFLTYRDLKRKITMWSELEVTEDNIRQMISRYSRNIPLWNVFFPSTSVVNPESNRRVAGFMLAEGFSSCILCRGDEVLPGEL